eukprot:3284764-Pleurochrysis_carterae.AAC.2
MSTVPLVRTERARSSFFVIETARTGLAVCMANIVCCVHPCAVAPTTRIWTALAADAIVIHQKDDG